MWKLAILSVVIAGPAVASEAAVCAPSAEQEALAYLKRLSLDLRGHLPDIAEYEHVLETGSVPEQLVDEMLASEGYLTRMRRYHRDMLWVNVSQQRLANNNWRINGAGRSSAAMWMNSGGRSRRYRGDAIGCADFESYNNPDGSIFTQAVEGRPGVVQEGWVWVRPYWAPDRRVKVCAFDAQETLMGTMTHPPRWRRVDCSSGSAVASTHCGCGPNLRWCLSRATEVEVRAAMEEQLLRFTESVVRDDRPYSDLILAKDAEVNGVLAHYLRHQGMAAGNAYLAEGDPGFALPDELAYVDREAWQTVQRNELHSGVLTLPGFLTRFQSDRGRANRFYHAFRCEAFQAPPGGLPATDDACHDEPNLTKRCGCSYCHVTLEPAAAHWGRWAEAGIRPLMAEGDGEAFPAFDPDCATPAGARTRRCRLFYMTEQFAEDDPRHAYRGYLLSYLFAENLGAADGSFSGNIEAGPGAIAQGIVDPEDGTFARCVTQRMFERFMGRGFREVESTQRQDLTAAFQDGFNLRSLIRSVVTSDAYRRGARFGMETP